MDAFLAWYRGRLDGLQRRNARWALYFALALYILIAWIEVERKPKDHEASRP